MRPDTALVLVGGGGHCRSVIDMLECAQSPIAGIVHGADCAMEAVLGYPALGDDAALPQVRQRYGQALVTVGHIANAALRQKLYAALLALDFTLPLCVSPLACVSAHAHCGQGTVVMHHALVNAAVRIGNNCIINSKALVEHDCRIGDHCHIAVGAILCGQVCVRDGVFVGAGAVVRAGVTLGEGAVIGCGTTVLHDVAAHTVYTGLRPHEQPRNNSLPLRGIVCGK